MQRKFKRSGQFYVYILECMDGSYYTGHTNDIQRRIKQHNQGKGAWYTRIKGAAKVVWRKEYHQFKSAFITEKRIKTLTRKEKESLVRGKRLDKVLIDAGK